MGREKNEGEFFLQDEWVRELVLQLPEVLWVIFGREKLKWAKLDEEWNDYVEQHLVGKLSALDCKSFLESCGIVDRQIQDIIVESSMGLPYYLDISVDTYEKILEKYNRPPAAEDFGKTNVELMERFMKYLDQHEIETLKVLSSARFWDVDIFRRLIDRFKTCYPITAIEQLCEYSFINEREGEERTWYMHDLMRRSLQNYQSKELLKETHHFLFDYYNDQVSENGVHSNESVYRVLVHEAFYHASVCLSEEDFSNWFDHIRSKFTQHANSTIFISLTEKLIKMLPENHLMISHLNFLIYHYTFDWKFSEAKHLIDTCFQIINNESENDWLTFARLLRSKAWIMAKAGGDLAEAEDLLQQSIHILHTKERDDIKDDLSVCFNYLGLNYSVQNKYKEAEEAFQKAIQYRIDLEGDQASIVGYYNNLCSLYLKQNKIHTAFEIAKKAYNHSNNISRGNPSIITIAKLGQCYFGLGEYEKAKEIQLYVMKQKEEQYGTEHSILSGTYHDLGNIYYELGEYNQSEHYLKKAIAIREEFLGELHPGVGHILIDYAKTLLQLNQKEKAITQLLNAKEIAVTVQGMSFLSIQTLITMLSELNVDDQEISELQHLFR